MARGHDEPPAMRPIFVEDWGCAVLYFNQNVERIKNILELSGSLNIVDERISRWLLEFSAVLLVSALEAYCSEKLRELGKSTTKYRFQNPTECNKAFKELVGIEVLKVGHKNNQEDEDHLCKMILLAEKRHCIVHTNSKVNQRSHSLKKQFGIGAVVPLDKAEIEDVMACVNDFVSRVEDRCPSQILGRRDSAKC